MSDYDIKIPFPEFHRKVNEVSKSLYETEHYTDALRKASIKLEEECKKIYLNKTGDELTGVPLMQKLFSYNEKKEEDQNFCECHLPVVNISTKKGVVKQKAYGQFFAGFMEIIRNTLAHNSDDLDELEALYGLNIVSYLFYKLDQAIEKNSLLQAEEITEEQVTENETLDNSQKEDFMILILSDEEIKKLSEIETDDTNLILSIEKRVKEILVENVDELGIEIYNIVNDNNELQQEIYQSVLQSFKNKL